MGAKGGIYKLIMKKVTFLFFFVTANILSVIKKIITIKSVNFTFALKPSSGYNTDTGIIGLSVSIVSAPVSDVQQCTPVNSANSRQKCHRTKSIAGEIYWSDTFDV